MNYIIGHDSVSNSHFFQLFFIWKHFLIDEFQNRNYMINAYIKHVEPTVFQYKN